MPTQTFLDRIVPTDSFIGRYMAKLYATESPLLYDFWCALWVLGSCLGRSVYVARPHAPVYMNWYVILVAESGVTRKSTSVSVARNIAALADTNLVEGRVTPQYLWQMLAHQTRLTGQSSVAVVISELVTFLNKDSHLRELPGMLTDLYDCPEHRTGGGTLNSGNLVVHNAFLTLLSASTQSWLRTAVSPAVIEGGFTSRCLFIAEEQPKQRIAWPTDATMDMSDVVASLRDTVSAAQHVGAITVLPSAIEKFTKWYQRRDISSVDPFVASFNSREDGHVLRMAACLAINDGSLAVYPKHMTAAIALINEVKTRAIELFHETGTPMKLAAGISRISDILNIQGNAGILRSQLYSRVRHTMTHDEFDIVLHQMIDLSMLKIFIEKSANRGVKPQRIVRDEGLNQRSRHKELLRRVLGD